MASSGFRGIVGWRVKITECKGGELSERKKVSQNSGQTKRAREGQEGGREHQHECGGMRKDE